ncbi:hypothetical protein D3C73_657350 [compost metagenome]
MSFLSETSTVITPSCLAPFVTISLDASTDGAVLSMFETEIGTKTLFPSSSDSFRFVVMFSLTVTVNAPFA